MQYSYPIHIFYGDKAKLATVERQLVVGEEPQEPGEESPEARLFPRGVQ